MSENLDAKGMSLAPGVVDTIITITANEQDGVASVGSFSTSGIRSMLQSRPSTSGVETKVEDGKLTVILHIEVYYGYVLPELADNLRKAISDALLVQVGMEVNRIDIYIDGIQFDQQKS